METDIRYKGNVAAIMRNGNGDILICERLKERGAWQFPQGGIDEGETLEQSLRREILEEIGVEPIYYKVTCSKGPYRYEFGGGKMKKGFHGKEQHYFLCDFTGADSCINVTTLHPEFRAFRWIQPCDFQISWLPDMKQAVYRAVLRDFFQVVI